MILHQITWHLFLLQISIFFVLQFFILSETYDWYLLPGFVLTLRKSFSFLSNFIRACNVGVQRILFFYAHISSFRVSSEQPRGYINSFILLQFL